MGELGALFNPGMRHELQERQAKAARREEEGNATDGDLRIDLESGVAVINVPADGQAQGPVDEHRADNGAAVESPEPAAPPAKDPEAKDPAAKDPAAVRPRGKRGLSASHR